MSKTASQWLLKSSSLRSLKNLTLVMFVRSEKEENRLDFDQLMNQLNINLPERLSSCMIPTAYILAEEIHMSAGRKINRRQLQEIGANLNIEQLTPQWGGHPPTESEIRLQQLWEIVLGVFKQIIQVESSFFRLGGDSIAAMRLASLARSQSIPLTIPHVLSAPRLSEMAKAIDNLNNGEKVTAETIKPFSLLRSENKYLVVHQIADQCDVNVFNIEDVFPCTSIQKELLSMTAKRPGDGIAIFNLQLRENVDVDRLQQAWEQINRSKAPILRCGIVEMPMEDGLIQVQINEAIQWDSCQNFEKHLQKIFRICENLDQPLTRLTMIDSAKNDGIRRRPCLLTQHHSIYDGYSWKLLVEEVSKAYLHPLNDIREANTSTAPLFQTFMKYVTTMDKEKAKDFWRCQFSGIKAVLFPHLPHHEYRPKANSAVRRTVDNLPLISGIRDVTASTIIRAAWSILVAHHTDSHDVVFGALVTSRQAPIEGIDRMIAPLIAALPIRITAYERKLLPRTRPEIYAIPKGKTLVLSFEVNERLISREAVGQILCGVRDILIDP